MNVADQVITDRYALYLGDNMEVMPALPDGSIHLSIYSPPFGTENGALYKYTSNDRDLSNSRDYAEFFEHYGHVVRQLSRLTMPGRMSAVHCTDVPTGNSGGDALRDFPGDVVRLHEREGWSYNGRYHVWKEPLTVRNRTMRKDLAHKTLVEDSSRCTVASADYLLLFRRRGRNPVPIAHPTGLTEYFGERQPPADVLRYRNWQGNQRENKHSQWVWRQYASAFWDDVRLDRVLPFEAAKDDEDERHVHALQLDVIDRALILWSNPGERVLTPFMGVGSEVHEAVALGRFGLGAEIKPGYYRQAAKNVARAEEVTKQADLFGLAGIEVA